MTESPKFTRQLSALKYASYGLYPVVPIFFGLTSGLILDSIFDTGPIIVLVFLFLGVIASFYNLFALVREIKKNGKRSPQNRTSHKH